MHRFVRMLAVAVLASTSLAFAGSSIPNAAAAVCATGQNQAFITLHSTMSWLHYRETYSGGGMPTISGVITLENHAPAGRITYTFCVQYVSRQGWIIRKAPDVVEYAYLGLDSNLNAYNGTGFALRATYVNAKSLIVEPTMCRHDGRLDFLKWITSLPIPGVSYVVSVGLYIVSSGLPSGGTQCQAFGDDTDTVSFNPSNGNTTGSSFYDVFYHKVQIKIGNCVTPPNSCWDVDEYRWWVTP